MAFAWEILRDKTSIAAFRERASRENDSNALLFFETTENLYSVPKFQPMAVQIEPTDRCNLKCKYCPHTSRGSQSGLLSLSDFRAILDAMPYIKRIHLQGLGEPFLNRQLFEMISFARSQEITVSSATNGTICTEAILNSIKESDLNELAVSIDTLDPEIAKIQRVGSVIDRIWNNLRQFVSIDDGPVVRVWGVVTTENLATLPQLVKKVAAIGVKSIFLQEVQPKFAPSDCSLLAPSQNTPRLAHQMYQHLYEVGKTTDIEVGIATNSTATVRQSCLWPWTSVYIKANGDVTPCCVDLDYVCGNILRDAWEEIWQNHSYRNFRKNLKHGPLPNMCEACNFL